MTLLRTYMPSARYFAGAVNDPFTSLERFVNSAMSDLTPATKTISVRMDVREDEKAYHVTADLPGLNEKDIELTFDDGVLTLSGKKAVERDEKKDTWHLVERSSGSFSRQLAMPIAVDKAAIEAKFDRGVLQIMLPKMEEQKPVTHKIEIKSA